MKTPSVAQVWGIVRFTHSLLPHFVRFVPIIDTSLSFFIFLVIFPSLNCLTALAVQRFFSMPIKLL